MSTKIVVFSPTTFFLYSIVRTLMGNGFQIAPISHLPSNLHDIEELHPDLLIVDNVSEFSQSVVEIVQALKANVKLAAIPVLFATSAETQRDVSHLSGVAVFTTPIHSTSLLEWIRQTLGAPAGK